MKLILVPTDFSENANTAIEYACELAKSLGGKVIVTNIYTPAVTKYNVISPLIQDEINHARIHAETKLKAITDTIAQQYPGLANQYEFQVGGIVESIESMVSTKNVDMVVMGTRGASGLDRIFFGSNTTSVIEKVKSPVLAVPHDCEFQIPKRIIYATDFNNAEIKNLGKVISIGKSFNAEIMLTHITTNKEAEFSEVLLKNNFSKRVSQAYDYPSITYFVKYEENIPRALETIVTEVGADWISLMTHDRTFIEKLYNPSLTKKMAYHSKIPLLAIKA